MRFQYNTVRMTQSGLAGIISPSAREDADGGVAIPPSSARLG